MPNEAAWEVDSETPLDQYKPATPAVRVDIPITTGAAGSDLQLAYQNNNPGNIRYAGQPNAEKGVGGYAKFKTAEDGYQEIHNEIRRGSAKGDTLESYISRYAPKEDHNDTEAYIQNAMKDLGVDRKTALSSIDADKLARFQAKQESGSTINGGNQWEVAEETPIAASPYGTPNIPGYGTPPGVPQPKVPGLDAAQPQAPATPPGLVKAGNIDLKNRPVVRNPDGTSSTVRTITIEENGKTILIPTVVNGKIVSNDEAIKHFHQTGEHMGIFKTEEDAEAYDRNLHNQMGWNGPPGSAQAAWQGQQPTGVNPELTTGTGMMPSDFAEATKAQDAAFESFMQRWGLPKFAGKQNNPNTPATQAERASALGAEGASGVGLTDEQLNSFAKGVANAHTAQQNLLIKIGDTAVGLASPENIGIALGAEFGAGALKAAVNAPKVVRLLEEMPGGAKIKQALDFGSRAAVPAVFGTQAASQSVAAAKAGQPEDAVINALFAAASFMGVHEAGKGVAEAYPSATEKATTPGGQAAATAKAYAAAGENLKASEWAKAVKVPVDFEGDKANVNFTGSKKGVPQFNLVDKEGEVRASGSYDDIQDALKGKPAEPPAEVSAGKETPPAAPEAQGPQAPSPAEPQHAPAAEPAAARAPESVSPQAPAPPAEFKTGVSYEKPSGKFTVLAHDGDKVVYEFENKVGGKQTFTKPVDVFRKIVAGATPPAAAEATPPPLAGPVSQKWEVDSETPIAPVKSPESGQPISATPAENKPAIPATGEGVKGTDEQPLVTEVIKPGTTAPEQNVAVETKAKLDELAKQRASVTNWDSEKPRVVENIDRAETLKPTVAAGLAPGSTRVNPKGGVETLERVPIDKIVPAKATEGRPQGNTIYPKKVAEYQETPSPVAPELRTGPDGKYVTYEGHHRIEAAKANGEKTILAWTSKPGPDGLPEVPVKETAQSFNSPEAIKGNLNNSPEAIEKPTYHSTQVNLHPDVAEKVVDFGKSLPPEKLSDDGREVEPHITLQYGLDKSKTSEDVAKSLEGQGPITAKLGTMSVFKSPEHDVLKVDVTSADLHAAKGKIKAGTGATDTFPDYKPHVTVAYLKPGEGAKYVGRPLPGVTGKTLVFKSVTFSPKGGEQQQIPLGEHSLQPLAKPEKTNRIEETNATNAPAGENPQALGRVPSENVPGAPAVREARGEPAERGQVDEGRDSGPRGEGTPDQSGAGDDERAVGVPAAGERRVLDKLPTAADYRITEADRIGEGSVKQKASDNLAAIRILKDIESAGRAATPEEQKILVKYTGWGGMPQPFMDKWAVPREWAGVREELNTALTDEEFASARASTPNAHYTSPTVIKGMWDAVQRLGLNEKLRGSSAVLEPSMGVGHFFGMMPESIDASRTGIELDAITGRIAKLLYPHSDIHVAGFEKVRLPNDFYDLAISNVPFGNYGIHDPAFKRNRGVTKSIHDYFFAKALDKVRPGGVVAFITSNFTMDKRDPFVRNYLADHADLIGAIRLPNTAFKGNAGTEVTTDIIFLQKRGPKDAAKGETWSDTKPVQTPDGEVEVNEYYARHPEMMLGQMGLQGTMYAGKSSALTGDLTPEKLAEAVNRLPENVLKPWTAPVQAFESLQSIPNSGDVKEGAYAVKDDRIVVRHGDLLKPVAASPEVASRIRGMISIRDAAREVFQTQINDAPEGQIKAARIKLNATYDVFTKKNGPLHQRKNVSAFAEDPDAPLLLSLENWDPEKKIAAKTDIFSQRTIDRYKPAVSANNAIDALGISLNESGRLDWARMQDLTGRTPEELQKELGALIYRNPEGKTWEPADEYLSGPVRNKLAAAEAAARTDKGYERNVEALKAVQPKDLEPEEIEARLGSSWIPKTDIRDFISELLEMPVETVKVGHSEALASWTLDLKRKDTVANSKTYGTSRMWANELIEDALNLRNPTVYDYVGSGADRKQVINQNETLAAREMQQQIKEKFAEWAWKHPERSDRLAETYNAEFNGDRLWQPDGSHLTFPGMSAGLTLRPHQKNAVWRIVRGNGNVLLAHVVGAGKTLEIVAGAMELRRLGQARKPMIVVPKNRVDGTAEEFLRAYPAANILVMSSEDFTKGNRQKMMARIATGNWDSVIVSYESFEKIPVSDETFNGYINDQIDDLEMYIREAKADKSDAKMVKELEKSKKRLEAKLRNKADTESKDRGVSFEELGVDHMFVDEADNFKNLFFPTKMTRIAGIPNSESKRAFDMYIKTQHVAKTKNGKGIVFATGTPIANTMAEMWTMQRYLQPEYLRAHGLQHFDAWAQTFGEVRPTLEVSPDGAGFRMTNRFSKFVNIPELVNGFRQVADVQTADMLKLPVPTIKGGTPEVMAAPASPAQKAYIQDLAARAKAIRDGKVKDPRIDNMLKVSTDGRKAALDIRLVDPSAEDFPGSKVNQAVKNIVKIWKRTADKKLTQLVFLDFSKPADPGSHKFSVSDDLKSKLIASGIPANEVAFIHEGDTDAARELLFQKVNDGRVRIMIGSTQKMGVGVNVQRLQKAQHHLDAPWRPRDIEQREGRGVRQGNTNDEIEIYRYVTEPSFDAKMWDTLKTKATFIGQVMRGDVSVRKAEDISENALSFGDVAAIASGNPAIREKTIVDADVRKLDALRSRHDQQQVSTRRDLQSLPPKIQIAKDMVERAEADIKTRDEHKNEFTIGKETFTGDDARKEAGAALHKILEKHRGDKKLARGVEGSAPLPVGMYRGFRIEAQTDLLSIPKEKGEEAPLPDLRIVGKLTYNASTNQYGEPTGTIQSIESRIRNIESIRDAQKTDEQRYEKQLRDTKAYADKPFEQQDKLKELLKRQAELAKQLQETVQDTQAMGADVEATPEGTEVPEGTEEAPVPNGESPEEVAGTGSMNNYTPGRQKIKADEIRGWLHGTADGENVYSNGHFMIRGETPKMKPGQFGRDLGEKAGTFFEPQNDLKPLQAAAFSPSPGENIKQLVWFDDGTAIDSRYYDLFKKKYPEVDFFMGKQPKSTTPMVIAEAGAKTVGVIMPVKVEMPPSVRDIVGTPEEEKPLGLNEKKSGERGSAPILTDLAKAIADKVAPAFRDDVNYSGIGAVKDVFVRNLSQLSKASPEADAAALKLASYKARAATVLHAAIGPMEAALKGSDISLDEVFLALIQDRLDAIRDKVYLNFASQTVSLPADELEKAFNEHLANILDAIEGRQGLPGDLSQIAGSLAENKQWADLGQFLHQAFSDAAGRVATVMEPVILDYIANDPQAQKAIAIYRNGPEKAIADAHTAHEGVFSAAIGDKFGAYYPLIPVAKPQTGGPGRRAPYRKPRNVHNLFATGLSDAYDPGRAAFRKSLEQAIHASDKFDYLKVLQEEGWLEPAQKGQKTFIQPNDGREVPGSLVEITPSRIVVSPGQKPVFTRPVMGIMPQWLKAESDPLLEGKDYEPSNFATRIINAINTYAVMGVAEPIFHGRNILGGVIQASPFIGKALAQKGMDVFLKDWDSAITALNLHPSEEEVAKDLIEMAKYGIVPDRFGGVSYSKAAAEQMGGKQTRFGLSPLLFGTNGLDIKARWLLYRVQKQLNPNATAREINEFVNQLGNYTHPLQSKVERFVKSIGLSPFYTAGSAGIRRGIKTWTGMGANPHAGWNASAWSDRLLHQLFVGGVVGVVLWALIHKAVTGKNPEKSRDSELGYVPLPKEYRHSAAGNFVFGKGSNGVKVNVMFWNPDFGRGARALGLARGYKNYVLGGNAEQILEGGATDMFDAYTQPLMGPAPRAALAGGLGIESTMTGTRDSSGRTAPQFFPALPKKTNAFQMQIPGTHVGTKLTGVPAQAAWRASAATKEMNSFYHSVGEATGLFPQNPDDKNDSFMRGIVNLALPGLFGNASNSYAAADRLRRQRAGMK